MLKIIEKTKKLYLKSWADTKNELELLSKDNYHFRGHKFGSWQFNSSFERNHHSFPIKLLKDYYLLAFKEMAKVGMFANVNYSSFCKATEDYFNYDGLVTNFAQPFKDTTRYNQFLEVLNSFGLFYKVVLQLQHHNISTHLIDITKSFYIAAYFSLFHTINEIDVKEPTNFPLILAIQWNYNPFNTIERGVAKDKNRGRKLQECHERIALQQGLYIDPYSKAEYKVYKYSINPDWVYEIYNDLKSMAINGYNLFKTYEAAGVDHHYSVKYGKIF